MALPSDVTKATGLTRALDLLELRPQVTIGVVTESARGETGDRRQESPDS
jgi:hypothetical protein